MFNFFSLILVIIGIIGLLYLRRRYHQELQSIQNSSNSIILEKIKNKWQGLDIEKKIEQLESAAKKFLEKALRRLHVLTLRVDNTINQWISKLKEKEAVISEKKQNLWPRDAQIWNLAKHKDNKKNKSFDQEEKILMKRLTNNPDNLENYKNLARFYLNNGEYKNCRQILIEAWKRDKDDKIISDLLVALNEKENEDENIK